MQVGHGLRLQTKGPLIDDEQALLQLPAMPLYSVDNVSAFVTDVTPSTPSAA
jgi:hypothetical protein